MSRQDLDSAISIWPERFCVKKKKNLQETQSIFFKREVFFNDKGIREIAISPTPQINPCISIHDVFAFFFLKRSVPPFIYCRGVCPKCCI